MKKIIFLFLLFASMGFTKSVNLEQMISQMILVGFSGTKTDEKWVLQIARDIKDEKIGGVILFAKNIHSPTQLKKLNSFLQQSNPSVYPLFIAIDEEGGSVQRLTKENGFHDELGAFELASKHTLKEALEEYTKLSLELHSYGFNLNFAPVVDLNLNPNSPAIGAKGRSYSEKEEIVNAYASVFLEAMRKEGVLSTLKHFPGHGSATSDTHHSFTDITDTWQYEELKPYYNFIKYNQVDSVMVGHLVHKGFDKDLPATLSKNIVTGILREKLGFDGVVISDDMQMKAISDYYTLEQSVLKAVDAGVDILLFSNYFSQDSNIVKRVHLILSKALKDGKISKQRIEKSYQRIIKLKERIKNDID